MTPFDSPARQLERYLQAIAGGRLGDEFLEIRYATGDGGMRRRFISIQRLDAAVRAIRSLSPSTDVYCGVLLRSRRAGGREAVSRSHLAFVEIDHADGLDRLQRFARPPSMIVSSGTAGHVHSYWILHPPLGAIEIEQANRTLAGHLGGDLASVDAARILRPAGTLSHKYRPPVRVELLYLDPTVRYESAELLEGFTAAPSGSKLVAGTRARAGRTDLDERLLAIPAARYVRELAGLEARRDGKVNCPFHPDDTPSLQLYEDGTFYCYGCATGGSVYDFAATLWLSDGSHDGTWKLRGREFLWVRQRLVEVFLGGETVEDLTQRSSGR